MSITISRQGLPSVEIDGRTVEIPEYSETYEVIIIGDDVYVMGLPQGYEQRRDVRMTRDDYNDQSFDLFYFFDYHRLLGFYPRGSEEEFWLPEELADETSPWLSRSLTAKTSTTLQDRLLYIGTIR